MFEDENKIFSRKIVVLFQSAQQFYEKREGAGSVLVNADQGGPKNIDPDFSIVPVIS